MARKRKKANWFSQLALVEFVRTIVRKPLTALSIAAFDVLFVLALVFITGVLAPLERIFQTQTPTMGFRLFALVVFLALITLFVFVYSFCKNLIITRVHALSRKVSFNLVNYRRFFITNYVLLAGGFAITFLLSLSAQPLLPDDRSSVMFTYVSIYYVLILALLAAYFYVIIHFVQTRTILKPKSTLRQNFAHAFSQSIAQARLILRTYGTVLIAAALYLALFALGGFVYFYFIGTENTAAIMLAKPGYDRVFTILTLLVTYLLFMFSRTRLIALAEGTQ